VEPTNILLDVNECEHPHRFCYWPASGWTSLSVCGLPSPGKIGRVRTGQLRASSL